MIKKNIKLALFVLLPIILIISCWFIFDFSSKIDVLRHPEKYSFNMNHASQLMQNDYYVGKYLPEWESFYRDLKEIEKTYKNKTDETSLKIIKLNNVAFDVYHDIMTNKHNIPYSLNAEDFIFLSKNNEKLLEFFLLTSLYIPQNETFFHLNKEIAYRKEALKVVKEDLISRKIDAKISKDDIMFENLSPVYIDEKFEPEHIKEFHKIIEELSNKKESSYEECLNSKTQNEMATCIIQKTKESQEKYYQSINNLDESWKHRYTILAIEKKKNGDKIFHLYEVHPYKEGNRYYWDIQYYSPTSEFLKAYLKMLELLMNL